MKILDRYILTTYLRTFLSVFAILLLIFVLQMIWLYIKELAGKDLDLSTIMKFIVYGLPKLIPLVLPLTILLTSIMVFGNFAENYEFAAMKSTGISLQRAMASLGVFIVALGFVTFWFSNNVIPWGEFNFFNLRKNLAKVKPSMAIAEGQFNEIESTPYNIKVAKKTGDKGQFLEDVIIHKKARDGRRNATTITAKTGELISREDSNVLKLVLYDGNFYEDVYPKKIKDRKKYPFAKSNFEVYTMNIDLSNLQTVDMDDKSYSNKYSMLNVSELDYTIDSLTIKHEKTMQDFGRVLYQRSNIDKSLKPPVELPAPEEFKEKGLDINGNKIEKDSIKIQKNTIPKDSIYTGELRDLFSNKKNSQFVNTAISNINSIDQLIKNKKTNLEPRKKWYNRHIISFHEKLALPFACIILFFVGAPLGALIRKGGIGLPMVIAILLFLTYHFIGIFAMNSAKNGSFNPILASWFSTLIMLPLGVYLTKKATADRGLFETEGVLEPIKKLFGIKKKDIEIDTSIFEDETEEYKTLRSYDEKELIKVIKNYSQYGYSRTHRNTAVSILNSRGISNQQLKFSGNFDNQKFEEGIRLKYKFDEDSKLAFILYAIAFPLIIGGLVLENNTYPLIGNTLFVIGLIIGVVYLFALVKSFISSSNLNKHLGKESGMNAVVYLLFGLPLYFIFYLYQKKATSEALYLNPKKTFSITTENEVQESRFNLEEVSPKLKDYKDHALFAIILFCIGAILLVLHFVFKNNKLPSLESASIQLSIIALALYVIYYTKSILNIYALYKAAELDDKKPNILLLILGMPFYMITHFFLKGKINRDITHI
ncbi:YjgP/YjgQ family permease [Hyunsoonleella flava]|uniref:YjgP/YjgQ family permease n=1 Tax=Hyunsoonleella flava TaxID=2527939 RepID=A0A4Q9FDP7_9FLAO|nr:LptF/LptG family permease [Hyunsoonleella flava]TBN04302.1 YjgP/YjgQ family permease [Hyunsoonleella flava]